MNKVILMGRLTRDPEVRYSQGATATAIARFSIAVDRRFKRDGEPDADFINCVAFGKTGEFIERYGHKGMAEMIKDARQTSDELGKFKDMSEEERQEISRIVGLGEERRIYNFGEH